MKTIDRMASLLKETFGGHLWNKRRGWIQMIHPDDPVVCEKRKITVIYEHQGYLLLRVEKPRNRSKGLFIPIEGWEETPLLIDPME